jgi:hypothetical protein
VEFPYARIVIQYWSGNDSTHLFSVFSGYKFWFANVIHQVFFSTYFMAGRSWFMSDVSLWIAANVVAKEGQ